MTKPKIKTKKEDDLKLKIEELTSDLKRSRADFENYRKQVEREKTAARKAGADKATVDLLPVIDNVERAVGHIPEDISDHPWVKGIKSVVKQLDSTLSKLGVARIEASPGTTFNPEVHQAVHMDEDSEGDKEVIAEELQAGYTLDDHPIRHAMVKVTRK